MKDFYHMFKTNFSVHSKIWGGQKRFGVTASLKRRRQPSFVKNTRLFSEPPIPALEWILSSIAHKAHEATLSELLERCKKTGSSLTLINCCVTAFTADYVSARATALCSLICQLQDDNFPKHKVPRTLGCKVVVSNPLEEDLPSAFERNLVILGKWQKSEGLRHMRQSLVRVRSEELH